MRELRPILLNGKWKCESLLKILSSEYQTTIGQISPIVRAGLKQFEFLGPTLANTFHLKLLKRGCDATFFQLFGDKMYVKLPL